MIVSTGYGAASDVKPVPAWYYLAMAGVGAFLFYKYAKKVGMI